MKNKYIYLLITVIMLIYININIFASEDNIEVFLQEAIVLTNQGSYDGAITILQKAISKNRNSFTAYFLMGNAYQYKKNYYESIKHYKKSIQLNPELGLAYYGIARCYYYLSQIDLSICWLEKAKTIFYKQNQMKKYNSILNTLINLSEGERKKQYEKELNDYKLSIEKIVTPTPLMSRTVTVITDVTSLHGISLVNEYPYPLSIEDKPFDGDITFDDTSKKLYVPAEEFLKKLGLNSYYDYSRGKFIVNREILPGEFLRLDQYQTLYLSVIDSLNFLHISYIFNDVIGKPIIIVKPDGLDFEPGKYPVSKHWNVPPQPTPIEDPFDYNPLTEPMPWNKHYKYK
ncbi:MAG: tetratricopeptide repeat protein [Candidatus Eremiobacterota bacterium]